MLPSSPHHKTQDPDSPTPLHPPPTNSTLQLFLLEQIGFPVPPVESGRTPLPPPRESSPHFHGCEKAHASCGAQGGAQSGEVACPRAGVGRQPRHRRSPSQRSTGCTCLNPSQAQAQRPRCAGPDGKQATDQRCVADGDGHGGPHVGVGWSLRHCRASGLRRRRRVTGGRRGRAPPSSPSQLGEQPLRGRAQFCGFGQGSMASSQDSCLRQCPQALHPRPSPTGLEAGGDRARCERQQHSGKRSYKEVLLHQKGPYRQEGSSQPATMEANGATKLSSSYADSQVVKAKPPQPGTAPRPDCGQEKEHRTSFLRRMKGLCFNCLARDHKVAFCRNPTRCWRCRRFGHTSRECRWSIPEQTPSQAKSTVATVDDSLMHIGSDLPLSACERFDPMVLEAHLLKSFPPSSTTKLSSDANLHLPSEFQTPVLLRSEAEQLVGHELIKALGISKQLGEQLTVPPSSPLESPYSARRVSIVEHSVDARSLSHHQRTKMKSRKPIIKVVRDMLTKKWVFVKRANKKLNIVGKNGELDEDKLQEYADHLKDILPPNLLMALMSFKGRAFWEIVAALSPQLGG